MKRKIGEKRVEIDNERESVSEREGRARVKERARGGGMISCSLMHGGGWGDYPLTPLEQDKYP